MAYIDPSTVDSPKHSWKLKKVLFNSAERTKQGGWSVAGGEWEGEPAIGVRWNGDASYNGNPTSRGYATWFILPDGLVDVVLKEVAFLKQQMVTCEITCPEGYDLGAWHVVVTLGDDIVERLGSDTTTFPLPDLPKRLCISGPGYFCATPNGLRGCLKKGKWEGDVYSNGIAEGENPTSMEEVKDTFVHNVMKAVQLLGIL